MSSPTDLDFLLVASRDPLASAEAEGAALLALQLAASGRRVALFLVQNGVIPARRGARWEVGPELRAAGVRVQADAFSLRERGIDASALAPGVEATDLAPVLDALGSGARVLWC